MNERIRELADQAGFDAVSLEVFPLLLDLESLLSFELALDTPPPPDDTELPVALETTEDVA